MYHIPLMRMEGIPWTAVLATFWHALYLDTATTSYILLLPFFMLAVQGIVTAPVINRVNKAYTLVIIFISVLICVAELGIYQEWKTKLTGKALFHLQHPIEIYKSVSGMQFFAFLAALAGLTALGYFLYVRVFYLPVLKRIQKPVWVLIFLIIGLPLLFVGLRGGVSEIPITSGVSHFSKHGILNWAAMNSNYNLAVSYIEGKKFNETNPFTFYPMDEATETVARIHAVNEDTTTSILKVTHPNIVILLMESWSADLIESLGGEPGITPEFKLLEQEGLLFTLLYASGNRSQQGLASILAGFPAIPFTTITENPDKYRKLPSLPMILNEKGYHTSFYFGGDLDYGNIRAFLFHNEMDKIVEESDISAGIPRGRLGIHDEFMMALHADELKISEEPFFSILFTMSSHSPYDQPKEHSIDWEGPEARFINSAFYSDYSLGRYFELVKKAPWYDRTLFIIIADHSHNTYRNWPVESFHYRHIPMMFLGGALKEEFRGKQIETVSSNTDLPRTLLNQLALDSTPFTWSKDLLNPVSPSFAYFEINDGVGWKTPSGEFVYDMRNDHYISLTMTEGSSDQDREILIRQGKSYIQVLFQAFLDL